MLKFSQPMGSTLSPPATLAPEVGWQNQWARQEPCGVHGEARWVEHPWHLSWLYSKALCLEYFFYWDEMVFFKEVYTNSLSTLLAPRGWGTNQSWKPSFISPRQSALVASLAWDLTIKIYMHHHASSCMVICRWYCIQLLRLLDFPKFAVYTQNFNPSPRCREALCLPCRAARKLWVPARV